MAIFIARSVFSVLLLLVASVSMAQEVVASGLPTFRSFIAFPDVMGSDDNADWKKTGLKYVSLTDSVNTALQASRDGRDFFSYLLSLAINRRIGVLEYNIAGDGNHIGGIGDIRKVLSDNSIEFTEKDGNVKVKNIRSLSADIEAYYIMDGIYYDVCLGKFRHCVYAICPVMVKYDEAGAPTKFPLFWVRYKDIEPYLNTWFTGASDNEKEYVPLSMWFSAGMYKDCPPEDGQEKKEG